MKGRTPEERTAAARKAVAVRWARKQARQQQSALMKRAWATIKEQPKPT
jgi:hypothetical protein